MKRTKIPRNCVGNVPRKILSLSVKEEIVKRQNNRCFYCGHLFDEWFLKKHVAKKRTACFDHVLPFAFSNNNSKTNFVAACSECNQIKSSKVFSSYEEVVLYVRKQRIKKGLTNSHNTKCKSIQGEIFSDLCQSGFNESLSPEDRLHALNEAMKQLKTFA